MAGVGIVFFIADDGIHGMELWKSDGTAAGTSLVEDITPGLDANGRPAGSNLVLLGVLNGRLLFGVGYETPGGLWASDGTEAGTRRVSDVNPVGFAQLGGGPLPLGDAVELKGRLFFGGGTATSGGLFASDGTVAWTTLVKESRSSGDNPGPGRGHELWSSDGTTAGTRLVKDINAIPPLPPADVDSG